MEEMAKVAHAVSLEFQVPMVVMVLQVPLAQMVVMAQEDLLVPMV
jgi:hypothetical protein